MIERSVRRKLRANAGQAIQQNVEGLQTLEFHDEGYGELSLLLALSHPEITVITHMPDEERRQIAIVAAKGIADNIVFKS